MRCAQIAYGEIEPRLHLPISVLGETDGARLGNAFEPRCNVDTIAHQVAVALLDHIAQMNTDAKFNATLRREATIALEHAVLHLDSAADGVDHAPKLNDASVAGALDYAAVM